MLPRILGNITTKQKTPVIACDVTPKSWTV